MTDDQVRRFAGELIEIADKAAIDPMQWQSFSSRLGEMIPGAKTLFLVNDFKAATDIPLVSSGFGKDTIDDFLKYYGGINCWTPFNHSLPLMRPRRTEDLLPSSSFQNTEFYTDFLRHLPEADAGTAIKLIADSQRSAELAVHYSAKHNERINTILEPLLVSLAPAVRRSLSLLRVKLVKDYSARLHSIVEAIAEAAFVLTAEGRVVAANLIGQAFADEALVLRIGAGDKLETVDPAINTKITEAIRQAEQRIPFPAGAEAFRLSHPSGLFSLTTYPLNVQATDVTFRPLLPSQQCLLLIVRPLLKSENWNADTLKRHFGLSPAEARLATKLSQGTSLLDTSRELEITYETARTHLRAIFAKVGVRRQSELVASILPLIGMVS